MSSSNFCFLTYIQVSQEAGQVVWYSHLLKNFLQFIVIHTVKGSGIVNKTEIDVFLELSCFFDDPADVGSGLLKLIFYFTRKLAGWVGGDLSRIEMGTELQARLRAGTQIKQGHGGHPPHKSSLPIRGPLSPSESPLPHQNPSFPTRAPPSPSEPSAPLELPVPTGAPPPHQHHRTPPLRLHVGLDRRDPEQSLF